MNRFSVDLQALNLVGRVKAHATHDVAVVQVAVVIAANPASPAVPAAAPRAADGAQLRRIEIVPRIAVDQSAPSGILGVGWDAVEKFDQVLAANDIYVLGYPASIGIQQSPQIDLQRSAAEKGHHRWHEQRQQNDCLGLHDLSREQRRAGARGN